MRTVLLGLLLARVASAQIPYMRALDLAPPVRVRVTIPDLSSKPFVGRVERADSNGMGLLLTDMGSGIRFPWSKVSAIDRSVGRNSSSAATRGLLVGAAAGFVMYRYQIGYTRRSNAPEFNLFGLTTLSFVIAPGAGALLGYGLAGERWELVVDMPRTSSETVHFALAPNDDIRLTTERGVVRGKVGGVVYDSVIVGAERIAWRDVTTAEIRGGRNWKQGAFWGGVGLLAASVISEISEPVLASRDRPAAFAANAAFGVVLGSLVLGGKGWVKVPVRGLRVVAF